MLTLEELRQEFLKRFEYRDGELYLRFRKYNKDINLPAGSYNKRGYRKVNVNYKTYYVHRIVFLMHHGYLPPILDHIDGNIKNNKIENLREATQSQNQFNRKIDKDSNTGVKGVKWVEKRKQYLAHVRVNYKKHYVGCFKVLEDAEKAVKAFREKHHGKFARHS